MLRSLIPVVDMPKRKLQKFAQNRENPLVHEYPYSELSAVGCAHRGAWAEQVFGNRNPITIELGCGKGEYTVALARQYPERNFIGIDKKGARLWSGARDALHEGLTNACFIRADIHWLQSIFAHGEIDEVWITFPDPQMKKPRARLLSSVFFAKYTAFLKPLGQIRLKTDSTFLFDYTRLLLEANAIVPLLCLPNLYASVAAKALPRVQTYYEQQWLLRGKTIKYISFLLPHRDAFVEPLSEPEHDDYTAWTRMDRSYAAPDAPPHKGERVPRGGSKETAPAPQDK